ncbi:uncharacterized SAM-binding protein YcdF (DUF218 family) [Paenochrobactrum gallinarii]|uniref:Uncharacterized SAM-binding protein YcdF (DUF218 family) n=1 Tax=Paenochrobactrum gallinarii TaxID=643673 RepID=A0A841M404_9HYPH|nr:YdcF family protein [Paenochrobactrum gallinarii]MBB6260888.1 uncharacterized SAM-binding protein YcdF (DUF218 family) [Paenochrobactrum gallinarii]
MRRFRPISVILLSCIIVLAVGFFIFSEKVGNMLPPADLEPADAIIVLTGGKARLDVAIELLQDKKGQRLLISGVHPTTNKKALQRVTIANEALLNCCIDLDRTALNTIGNATESAQWIRSHNYKRVIVVTNNYHMPRSILELSRLMDNVEFIPYPVVNSDLRNTNWVTQGDVLRVLLTEYVKYLGALFHLTELSVFGGPEQIEQ